MYKYQLIEIKKNEIYIFDVDSALYFMLQYKLLSKVFEQQNIYSFPDQRLLFLQQNINTNFNV